MLFLNGLPLGIIELKNPADENADVWEAWQQLQTYQAELPTLFSMNEALIVSEGLTARMGTLGAGREWFKPWRTITGETLADPSLTELQVLLEGVCQPRHFRDLIRDFTVFDDDGSGKLVKKMAGYHQFHAVRAAVGEILRASELQDEARLAGEETARYESGHRPGRRPRRPPHRSGLAHPGSRQEPDHGLLRRGYRPRAGHAKPHHSRPHRPQRPGRPALHDLLSLPGFAAPATGSAGGGGALAVVALIIAIVGVVAAGGAFIAGRRG